MLVHGYPGTERVHGAARILKGGSSTCEEPRLASPISPDIQSAMSDTDFTNAASLISCLRMARCLTSSLYHPITPPLNSRFPLRCSGCFSFLSHPACRHADVTSLPLPRPSFRSLSLPSFPFPFLFLPALSIVSASRSLLLRSS